MTDWDDTDYDIYEIGLDELESLPYQDELAPGLTQYNTSNEAAAIGIIENAAEAGERVQIYAHDAHTDLMIPIGQNEGHNPGISASYLIETMVGDGATLAEEVRALGPRGDIGEIDFFQINVIHRE